MLYGYLTAVVVVVIALVAYTRGNQQLEISNLTTTVLELTYTDLSSGYGLHVISTQDSLYISTLDGRNLVSAKEATGGTLRLIALGSNMFIQAKTGLAESRDFSVPDAFSGILSNADGELLRDLLRIINTSTSAQESDAILWKSLLNILSYPETALMQNAAITLGTSGITGLQYPSVLPFYMATVQLQQLLLKSNLTRGENRVGDDCLSECPPCPYQECLGLCGYGCNCWKWVCGDCCYHLGCYEHDICCREKFVRTACLFPFKFRCESGYTCN